MNYDIFSSMVKPFLKKYRYVLFGWLEEQLYILKKYFLGAFFSSDPKDSSPLDVERLNYPVRWDSYFDFDDIYVEVGTGHGELIEHYGKKYPDDLHVGFEITKKYSKKTFNRLKDNDNAIAFKGDAYPLVLGLFKRKSIRGIHILFPDPWHKKRHHKRRPLVDTWFRKAHSRLSGGGYIFFATDWPEYFDFVLDQAHMSNAGDRELFSVDHGEYVPDEWGFIPTHYYKKWNEHKQKSEVKAIQQFRIEFCH